MLRLRCYSYISGIIQDHSMIHVWMIDPESRTVTRIAILDLPSGFLHLLVISQLPDLCNNWSMTPVKPSSNKMCIIFGSILVATAPFSMVTPYRQARLFLVADEMTIQSCSNGSFLRRWGVVNIRLPWHLGICRVMWEISHQPIINISESCRPNGLIQINYFFNYTVCVWANKTWDLYVQSDAGCTPFNIWQYYSVADHCIFGSDKA